MNIVAVLSKRFLIKFHTLSGILCFMAVVFIPKGGWFSGWSGSRSACVLYADTQRLLRLLYPLLSLFFIHQRAINNTDTQKKKKFRGDSRVVKLSRCSCCPVVDDLWEAAKRSCDVSFIRASARRQMRKWRMREAGVRNDCAAVRVVCWLAEQGFWCL